MSESPSIRGIDFIKHPKIDGEGLSLTTKVVSALLGPQLLLYGKNHFSFGDLGMSVLFNDVECTLWNC